MLNAHAQRAGQSADGGGHGFLGARLQSVDGYIINSGFSRELRERHAVAGQLIQKDCLIDSQNLILLYSMFNSILMVILNAEKCKYFL